jgi:histidine ammonia-lyase
MIPQYTAASIVSANKQLATPASIDSIVSSNGQEDHVSMGANSAVQAYIIIDNVERVLAIELFNASQALFFKDKSSSPFLNKFINKFRLSVPLVSTDRIFHEDIENSIKFIQNTDLDNNDLLF